MPGYRLLVAVMLHWLALFVLAPSALAQAPSTANHIAAELIAEGPVQPGGTVMLAIHMRPESGWHGYWRNPGDAGLGMTLSWLRPSGEGYNFGQPLYPVPQTLIVSGLMNHVFEHEYAVLVPFRLPAIHDPGGNITVEVKAQWLACTVEICVPEQAVLTATVPTTFDKPGTGDGDPRFSGWRAALAAPLDAKANFAVSEKGLRIAIPLPRSVKLADPHFFIGEDKVADYAAPQRFLRQGDTLVVEMARAKFLPASPTALSGVLRLNREGDGLEIAAKPGSVPNGGLPLKAEAAPTLPGLPILLLGALLGGLLLNVMPCVFPILSLKAMSLARAGESEAEARTEGLAYSSGVILACLMLGALLLALRAGGSEVGWAFQLQEPLVVAALLLLAVTITANLLGAFEFAVPGFASEGSPRNAFATGLLAAFVATPCTGPFMAAAMGAALLLPTLPAMALFVALGLGISLPFLAIAFIPVLRRHLPRPGAWMSTFRRWMALPMGLTAIALVWLASRTGGWAFAGASLAFAAWLAGALIATGRRQRAGLSAAGMLLRQGIAIALLAVLILPGRVAPPPPDEANSILPTARFSEASLESARASGRPVFAYFTADWCLTCKVNERVAIERADVRDAFAKAGVVVLRGDWTRRDPAITRFLTDHGAAGVPLYVWYPAQRGEPQILPQVLSSNLLTGLTKH